MRDGRGGRDAGRVWVVAWWVRCGAVTEVGVSWGVSRVGDFGDVVSRRSPWWCRKTGRDPGAP